MTRRRLILTGAALVGLVTAALTVWTVLAPSPVTKANYSRLKAGMTKDEIHAILGAPYDSHGTDERYIGYEGCVILFFDVERETLVWRQWEESPRRLQFPEKILRSIQWPINCVLRFNRVGCARQSYCQADAGV